MRAAFRIALTLAAAFGIFMVGLEFGRWRDRPEVVSVMQPTNRPAPARTLERPAVDALYLFDGSVTHRPVLFNLAKGAAGLWLNAGNSLQSLDDELHPTLYPAIGAGAELPHDASAIIDVAVDHRIWILHKVASPETRLAVTHVRPGSHSVASVILPRTSNSQPRGQLVVGRDGVWAVTGDETRGLLTKIDPVRARVVRQVAVGQWAHLAVGSGRVWLTRYGEDVPELLAIDPDSLRIIRITRLERTEVLAGLGVGHGSVWVSTHLENAELLQIEPRTGRLVDHYPYEGDGGDIAVTDRAIFTYTFSGDLLRFDLSRRRHELEDQIPVRGPADIVAEGDTVWLTSVFEAMLYRVRT